jgi:N utilization substance protein B
VWRERDQIDALLAQFTLEWSVDRLASTDRAILRMAVYEMLHLDTPTGVVINEAVGLAKGYGTEASGKFVNGVLGAIARQLQARSGTANG